MHEQCLHPCCMGAGWKLNVEIRMNYRLSATHTGVVARGLVAGDTGS
jgi:hypothetical protein